VIAAPVRTEEAVDALRAFDPREELAFVGDAVRLVRKHLHPRIPLIGFAGAPFTVAAYMIEGKGSRHYVPTKVLMHDHPQVWHRLLEKLTTATIDYLRAQAEAGCQVLQVFDSWVGSLSQEDYRRFVLPHTRRLFAELPRDVPTIHFGTDSATLLELQKEAGGDVIGLDWRVDIASAWDRLANVGVQGNLDPVLLFAEPKVFLAEAQRILESVGSRPGFIFNLGHGILPETPVEHVMELVDFVHGWKANLA
jgi:uroporphyrinogen decarboxylase